jgi:hypothetical protein
MSRPDEKVEEKHREEKDWRRDSLGGTIWALILIEAGVALLGVTANLVDWLDWGNVWGVIMIGASLLLTAEIAIRLLVPSYAQPLGGRIILAAVLAFAGISNVTGLELWPLILIALGLSIVIRGFTSGRR